MENSEKPNLAEASLLIEQAASGARIRALDVFFSYEYPQEEPRKKPRVTSFTYGEEIYTKKDGVLDTFFERYGTLALHRKSGKNFEEIASKTGMNCPGKKEVVKIEAPDYALKEATL